MSIRTEKVASVIVEALSEPLRKIASEINAGLITVTSVKMSPDLQIAKVYVSCIGGKASIADVLQAIELDKFSIRKHVAHVVQLRFAPELRFYSDETMDAMEQIQSLVEKTKKHDLLRDGNNSE
ncbi:MAG: 30S ribosome-binding factor RbfA [Candidatus Kapaibacteriota bacterium]